MSGLDPIGRKMVFDLVMELRKQGKTIFFCSHILNDVERLCDRIGLLNNGQLIESFEREDFLQNLGRTVFIHTERLSQDQLDRIAVLGGTFRDETEGHLLAISGDRYHSINNFLSEARVGILGCRSEWMSLEDLFMRSVGKHEA